MKKTIRTVLIASLAVVVVGSAAVGTSVLRASEEADSEYAAEPVAEENNVTFVEVPEEPEQPAAEPAAEPEEAAPAEGEEAEPAAEPAEGEEAEDPAEEPAEGEEAAEAEESEKKELNLKAWVTTSLDDVETVEPGTEITLYAHLEGFEGLSYVIQWQYSADNGETWHDKTGATGDTYTFALNADNDFYLWRINILPA